MSCKHWLGSVVVVAALAPGAAHAAPEASITPSSYDFGPLRVESADTLARSTTFVISNTGDADLDIANNGITIAGTNTGDFTITEKPSGNTTIPPGGMMTIDVVVEFDPTATGARSATLQVVSNAPAAATAALAGAGTSAVISVTDVEFGLVNPNSSSTKDITLSNVVTTDPGVLHVATATLAGGDGWFSFEGPICQGDVCDLHIDLPPDALLGVTCRPPVGATGVRTATVTFASDTDDPTDTVSALTCDAGAPDIDVVTASVAFGDVPINPATPPARTVTIGNTGSQTLRFTASAPSPLYTLGGCATNCPVPSGETRDFTVTFNPTAPTVPDANIDLTITSNDPGGAVTIPVTGRGIAGVLEVTVPPSGGDTIAFGGVARGTVATQDFTLTNTGNVDVVNIAAATPVPPDAGYSIDPMGPPVPATLGPGASVTLRARFAPDATADGGAASIAFSGTWGAATSTSDELKLTGDGLNIGFSLEPDTIAFGDLRFDTTPERTFCVVNNGETTLQIQSPISIVPDMTTMSDEFVVVRVRRPTTCGGTSTMDVILPQTLAPSELLEVTVRADPANRTGAMGATLTVMSDLPVSPSRTLTLSGTSTSGTLTVTPGATLDFGPVDVLAPAAAQMITITNTGDGPLDLGSFTLAPDPAPAAFTITPPVDTTLAPGGSLSIPVTYKPTMVAAEAVTLSHSVAGAINTPTANMIMIRGRGIDREIEVTTPMFPDTFRNPGDQAPVRPAKITNLGEAPLKVSGVMVTNDADVWQLLDPSPVVIPAGASHDLLVRFAPKISGRADADLLIVNDDRDEMLVKLELVANVIGRSVRFGPDEIQLGYTGVGVPVRIEDALVVTSTDKDRAYQIQKIEIDSGSPFTIEGLSPNLDLAPLAERKFAVTFTPRSQGPFTENVRLFLDMDPEAQHQVTLKGTAVFVDAHGGGGCATGSTGGGAGAAALALAALLGLHRRRPRAATRAAARTAGIAGAAGAAFALALAPAAAAADDLALSVFDPVPATASDGFQLQSPDVGKSGDWALSAVVSHATDPLILDGIANGVLLDDYAVISRSTVTNLGGAIAFLGRFEAGARIPLYVQEGQPPGDPIEEFTGQPAEGNARGDLALSAKARLVRKRLAGDGAFLVGLGAQLTLPTATAGRFTGAEDPSGRVQLLGSLVPGAFERRITLTMNLGGVIRARSTYANLEQKSGVAWGLGLTVRALDKVWLAGEVYGDTVPGGRTDEMTRSQVLSPIEWLAGLRWKPDHRFTVGLAAGRGLTSAVGTPAFRGVLALTLTPGAPELRPIRIPKPDGDGDGDGVRDRADRCPGEREDADLFDDTDGCPDPDNDGDGIADAQDRCPIEAEDVDGFEDADGCVDKDNDGDRIADALDRCPMQAEDADLFDDTDGCPDPDNDRDGVLDAADRCPTSPETINGKDDNDGCPDKGDSFVVLSPDRLELLDLIQFTATQKIAKASQSLLAQVGATMRARTEIVRLRITVHVQPTDDPDRDQALSDQRATAVREWLVQWGVAPERLEARGFGGTRPLVPADKKGAAALNQRVELIILERK